jgi:hypothetical protein
LLYGTPVPGYQAPVETVDPASEFYRLVAKALAQDDAVMRKIRNAKPQFATNIAESVVSQVREYPWVSQGDIPTWLIGGVVAAWTWMIGAISAELWGQLIFLNDVDQWYQEICEDWIRLLSADSTIPVGVSSQVSR